IPRRPRRGYQCPARRDHRGDGRGGGRDDVAVRADQLRPSGACDRRGSGDGAALRREGEPAVDAVLRHLVVPRRAGRHPHRSAASLRLELGLHVHAARLRRGRPRGVRQPRRHRPRGRPHRPHPRALRRPDAADGGGPRRPEVPLDAAVRAHARGHRDQAPGLLRPRYEAAVMRRDAGTPRPPAVRGYPYAWLVIFLGFMVLLRFAPNLSAAQALVFNTWLIYTIMTVGFYFVFGVSGQFAFSQAAFAMVGAYTSSWATREGTDWLLAVAFGVAVACLIAFLFAFVARKSNLFFLAIATLALSEIIDVVISQWNQFTGQIGAEIG